MRLVPLLLLLPSLAFAAPPQYLGEVGRAGPLNSPATVAIAPDGMLYITDYSHYRIVEYATTGEMVRAWGGFGDEGGQFYGPRGIVADGANVYVADDYHGTIQKFTREGAFVTQWLAIAGFVQSDPPVQGLALGPDGNLYVTDAVNALVRVFTRQGVFLRQWGGHGIGSGQFARPYDLCVSAAGEVFVADTDNSRVQVFTMGGAFLRKFSTGAPCYGVCADEEGGCHVTIPSVAQVRQYGPAGQLLEQWGGPGSGPGQFNLPMGLRLAPDGTLWVVDAYNDRVQHFGALPVPVRASTWGALKELYR